MEEDSVVEEEKEKFVWKQSYTWVLVFNAVYIVLFYLLMKNFA